MKGVEKVEATKGKNDKQAAEYIRRLVNEEIPEMKVEVNYSESKITESDGWSLLMVKRYGRNSETASSSTEISPRRAL